ncbi:MAG: NUDIX domain-containing protein [Chitinophagaceae bacterium]
MKKSAGILLYSKSPVKFFLVHPGGPFWRNKDEGAWTIPKGELEDGEDGLATAKREFKEETGKEINGNFVQLTPVKQKGGKLVCAWAIEGDIDAENITSNTFKIQWPPKSGKWIEVPEVDKAGWFFVEEAKQKINPAQAPLLDELLNLLQAG